MRYGVFGKHVELFDLWESANSDPGLAEAMGFLEEGTGAPEGRADFPIFLQTVIRHRMRERFRTIASKWTDYAGVESASDFREHTVSQMNGIVGIAPVRENGEYQRMRSSEEQGPSFAVAKHGGIYSVTFELIVNDETDYILNRAPAEIGRSSAEYKAQVLVNFIESNPTYGPDGNPFFSVARNNEFTGTAADPSEDNLITFIEAMQLRRDPNGIPYNVQPDRIMVRGARQKFRFQQIIKSSETVQQQTGVANDQFARGNFNPLYGIMPPDAVIDEPWLNDPDDYYVFGNADDRPAFIMSFLRGQQEPFIGIKDPGSRNAMGAGTDPYSWEFDSIDFKVRDVFGTSCGEPVAAIRARPA
jgi:hypothetical protein